MPQILSIKMKSNFRHELMIFPCDADARAEPPLTEAMLLSSFKLDFQFFDFRGFERRSAFGKTIQKHVFEIASIFLLYEELS